MITMAPPRSVNRSPRVPIRAEQWWIAAGAALLALLQMLALDQRNPLTRTLSSYEYTSWGWLFPLSLATFGVGVMVLAVRIGPASRAAAAQLAGAAVACWVNAAFPAGEQGGRSWMGEVHRWASIALVVLVFGAALALARRGVAKTVRSAMLRLVAVGAVAGGAFLAGQSLKPALSPVLGQAPLAGGLTQRILVAAVAAVLLLIAARRTPGVPPTRPAPPGE